LVVGTARLAPVNLHTQMVLRVGDFPGNLRGMRPRALGRPRGSKMKCYLVPQGLHQKLIISSFHLTYDSSKIP
jgi:hypothetical protein